MASKTILTLDPVVEGTISADDSYFVIHTTGESSAVKASLLEITNAMNISELAFETTDLETVLTNHFSGTSKRHTTDQIGSIFGNISLDSDIKNNITGYGGTEPPEYTMKDTDEHILGTSNNHSASDINYTDYDGNATNVGAVLDKVYGDTANPEFSFSYRFTKDGDEEITDDYILNRFGLNSTTHYVEAIITCDLLYKNTNDFTYQPVVYTTGDISFKYTLESGFIPTLNKIIIGTGAMADTGEYIFRAKVGLIKK